MWEFIEPKTISFKSYCDDTMFHLTLQGVSSTMPGVQTLNTKWINYSMLKRTKGII